MTNEKTTPNYDRENIFAKIIRGEIESKRVGESEHFVAIKDAYPQAPVHLLILPKRELKNLEAVGLEEVEYMGELLRFARQLAEEVGIAKNYQLHLNSGDQVQQVHHLHLHLMGGWKAGAEPK